MSAEPRIAALIVAAGRGARAGTGDPKQYRLVGGASVLGRVLAVFGTHAAIDRILVVTHPDDGDFYARVVAVLDPPAREKLASPVPGGATRQASVARGLVRLAELGHELLVFLKVDRDEGVDGIAGQQARHHEREKTHGSQDGHQPN